MACMMRGLSRTNRERYAAIERPVTSIERAMAEALTTAGLAFDPEVRFDTPSGSLFICDFIIRGTTIAIECDGDYWHSLPQNRIRDGRKDAFMRHLGYTVLRLWEHEIKTDVTACVSRIVAVLDH